MSVATLVVGDSIAAGSPFYGVDANYRSSGGFRRKLWELVPGLSAVGKYTEDQAGANGSSYGHNNGFGGQTLVFSRTDMLDSLSDVSVTGNGPVIVVAYGGTNDITNLATGEASAQIVADRLLALGTDAIAVSKVHAVVCCQTNRRRTDAIKYSQHALVEAALASAFSSPPAGVHFATPATMIDDSLLADSLHPSVAGYELIAENLAPILRSISGAV